MSATREPVPFEPYQAGLYLHGTNADLAVGEMLVPGRESNFEQGRVMNYVYFTATLDAAIWGAGFRCVCGPGRHHRAAAQARPAEEPSQGGSLNHIGVEVESVDGVDGEQTRLSEAGLASIDERGTNLLLRQAGQVLD
jgi:hypothetical protein